MDISYDGKEQHEQNDGAEEFAEPCVAFGIIALDDVLLAVIVQHVPLTVPIVAVAFLLFDLFSLKLLETRDVLLGRIGACRLPATLCGFPISI